jgi:hypothetical protein
LAHRATPSVAAPCGIRWRENRLRLSDWKNAVKCDFRTPIIAQYSKRVKTFFAARSKSPLPIFWPIRSRPVGRGRIGQKWGGKSKPPRNVMGMTHGAEGNGGGWRWRLVPREVDADARGSLSHTPGKPTGTKRGTQAARGHANAKSGH